MLKNLKCGKIFDRRPYAYGYTSNGCLIVLPFNYNYKRAKRHLKTICDLTGEDHYLYSLNDKMEIYFVRLIKTSQNV